MVSGSTKRKKKKASAEAAGAAGAGASQSQPQSQQRQRSDLDTTAAAAAEEEEEIVELDAEGQEILALAQALGEEAHAATGVEGSVTAGLARRLAERGVRLVVTPDKGRVCLAVAGFEPGRVVLEERAYVHGSGAFLRICFRCVGLDG